MFEKIYEYETYGNDIVYLYEYTPLWNTSRYV